MSLHDRDVARGENNNPHRTHQPTQGGSQTTDT
jgi:hypothetical protein